MSSLLDLDARLQELESLIDSIDSTEIPAELESAIAEILVERDETNLDYLTKIDNIIGIIQDRKHWIKIRKLEIERLQKLIKADENTVQWLSDYLLNHLESKDLKKVRTNRFNLSVATNGGKKPVVIDDVSVDEIPQEYHKVSVSLDKQKIRKALESGEKLDFAHLEERGQHLRIR